MKTMMVINTIRGIAELKVIESDGSLIHGLGYIVCDDHDIMEDGDKIDIVLTNGIKIAGHFIVDCVEVY